MSHRLEFRLSENPWAPTAVIEEVNARTGAGLILTGLADQIGGVSSAAFVQWPDGRQSALTRPRTPLPVMQRTAEIVNQAREIGLPVPAHQLIVELTDGYLAVVQERLPGRHAEQLDETTVESFIATNDRFAGLLRHRADVPPPPAFPEGPGYGPFEQTVGRWNEQGRRLLDRLREVDGGVPLRMHGDDLVHLDYTPGNVLFDGGRVSGVVDWNFGAARGDRHYALSGLKWSSVGARTINPAELDRIDQVLARIDPALRRSYEAHRAVHTVHRAIVEGFAAERVRAHLGFAAELLS